MSNHETKSIHRKQPNLQNCTLYVKKKELQITRYLSTNSCEDFLNVLMQWYNVNIFSMAFEFLVANNEPYGYQDDVKWLLCLDR